MIYFISGHLDLTKEEFEQHYIPAIDKALSEGAGFIVGDANGTDAMAQQYLSGKTENVVVYHMFISPRNNEDFVIAGGYTSDESRDSAMTKASDADIAWVRPGREKSGTAKNLKRRLLNAKT